jgi:hypothetical protein
VRELNQHKLLIRRQLGRAVMKERRNVLSADAISITSRTVVLFPVCNRGRTILRGFVDAVCKNNNELMIANCNRKLNNVTRFIDGSDLDNSI